MEAIGERGELDLTCTRPIADLASSGYSYFRDGDIAFAKITPCFENGKGALMRGLNGGIGFGTTELIVLRPLGQRVNPEFLDYVIRSAHFRIAGESHMYGAGGQKRVPDAFVHDYVLALPTTPDQRWIAAFLDRETAKIDALIAEQERLIELLKEKRQAVISQAVTKGLKPNAPMKPSGIEWVGDIPVHWELVPLKQLTDPNRPIMYGIVLPGPDVAQGIPVLKGGNVKPDRMKLSAMARTTPEIEAPYARARLKAGDIVYAIRGTIGECELVPSELEGSNITQDVARVAAKSDIDANWLRWALLSSQIREKLASGSLGAAVRGVNICDLQDVRVPTPTIKEQLAISAHIGMLTRNLDKLISEIGRAVILLQERRTELISAAVTGQIDIRGLAEQKAA
jgi:type I restriction enzyme S subunit